MEIHSDVYGLQAATVGCWKINGNVMLLYRQRSICMLLKVV